MKSITTTILLIFSTLLFAQEETYFNEWIDFNQTYHKFYIEEEGIYRIPYSVLQESGLAANAPEGFHLFSHGQEIPIYISTNNELTDGDYIEFYGKQNDGSFDTQLFEEPEWQLNDRKSLFTDMAAYYLMWDDDFEGLRMENVENDLSGELPQEETYFMYKSARIHTSTFSLGTYTSLYFPYAPSFHGSVLFADFEAGEGFIGPFFTEETVRNYRMNTFGVYKEADAPAANLQTKLMGKSSVNHHLQVNINEKEYLNEKFPNYETRFFETPVDVLDISSTQTEVIYQSIKDEVEWTNLDYQAVAYTFLTYPRQFDFRTADYLENKIQDATQFYFELQHTNEAYFEVEHFNGGDQAILYDLSHFQRYEIESQEDLYKIHLAEGTSMEEMSRKLFLTNTHGEILQTIDALQSFQFTDFKNASNQGDYIIISHPSLRAGDSDWVEAYGDYRASIEGGEHSVVIADIEELYDQFGQGIQKHPLAIRHFVNFAVDEWNIEPQNLFLIGKGMEYRTKATTFDENLIPSFGFPPSDFMLTVRNLQEGPPQLGIGRLSAKKPEDVQNYLNKVRQYETIEDCTIAGRAWRKQALFQANGEEALQYENAESYLQTYQPILENNHFGGKLMDNQSYKSFSPNFYTKPFIEQGLGLLQFIGYGNREIFYTDIWNNLASHQQVSPRFPMVFASCRFVGDVFQSNNVETSMAESWVATPDKGAICFLSKISIPWFEEEGDLYARLLQKVTQTNYNQSIGENLKETLQELYEEDASETVHQFFKIILQNYVFEGDPALVLGGGFENPEYVIDNDYEHTFVDIMDGYQTKTEIRKDVVAFNAATGEELPIINERYDLTGIEEVMLKIHVTNLGKAIPDDFELWVIKQGVEGMQTILATEMVSSPAYETTYEVNIGVTDTDQVDEYNWIVRIKSELEEDCKDNNQVLLPFSQGNTSIQETWYGENIKIYPNPVKDKLWIESSEQRGLFMQLMDSQGKLLQQQFMYGGNTILNLSQLNSGIYWLQLKGDSGTWSHKIVKYE